MPYSILPKLKSTGRYHVLSLDSEWDENINVYIWCVYGHYKGKEIKRYFNNKEDCSHFLFNRRWSNTVLTGVNLAVDLESLRADNCFDWDMIFSSNSFITAFPPKKNKKTNPIKIIDLSNFFRGKSLLKLCKDFNIEGYIDKHYIEDYTKREMVEACMSHAKAGVLVFEKFQEQIIKLGSKLEITPAMTAQKLHRRCYLPKKSQILPTHDKCSADDKLFHFSSMKGGRTENYTREVEIDEVSCIDINSSYPKQMYDNPIPSMTSYREIEPGSLDDLLKILFIKKGENYKFEGLAKVAVKTPVTLDIPLLGTSENGKYIFPVGTWTGTYTFPELRKAIELKYEIIAVLRIAIAKPTQEHIFKDYVEHLYELKQLSEYKEAAKLMLNSLYGKFGQKANERSGWVLVRDLDEIDINDIKKCFFDENGLIYEYIPETHIETRGFNAKSYPLIASYITAYARLYLYETMVKIGAADIYYVDTDSIYCDSNRLIECIKNGDIKIHESELGAWNVEHHNIDFEARGLKYYRYFEFGKWHYRIKGVPGAVHEEYWRNHKADFKRFVKYAHGIRSGKKINSIYTATKSDGDSDAKRHFISGYKSVPLNLQ